MPDNNSVMFFDPQNNRAWSLDELLDFHVGSLRTYIADDLSTANLPLEEVIGIAVSNTVRDAVERGDDLSGIRAWAERTLREEKMTDEQRAVAERSLKSFMPATLSEYVRSVAFKKKYGDWENGESDLVLDSRGEPLVLWHGSPAEFDAFDLSHAGENTGITEYTLKTTGEKTVSDSDKAVFFTDNRQLAVSYAFLARTQQLSRYSSLLTDIGSLLNNPQGSIVSQIHSKSELIEAVNELRKENDADMNAVLDRMPDLNGEHPVSSMPEADRKALAQDVFALRGRYSEYHRMNDRGGISNRLNNFVRIQEYLPYFRENFDRLCGNDHTVLSEFGDDISEHSIGFYREGNGAMGIHVYWDPDSRRVKASGFRQEPVFLDTLSGSERAEFLQMIDDDLAVCIGNYNEDMKRAGFERCTHLYPVFLKASNPLVHDYKESSFPDKYKLNEKYETAYIAARQVAKALADGNDAVVYQNIRDPFLGTTYGVFSVDNIIMIDKSMMAKEVLSPRLEVEGDRLSEKDKLNRTCNRTDRIKGQGEKNHGPSVTFIEDQSPYYKERTRKNAESADITVAFAVDFTTAGEKCTRNVAGNRYVAVPIPVVGYYQEKDMISDPAFIHAVSMDLENKIIRNIASRNLDPSSVSLNIAGNGIYTLAKNGINQDAADSLVTSVLREIQGRGRVRFSSIRSGGQTGIDEAGIKAAGVLGIPATVLAPQGWKFRDRNGMDISDEKAFKARFDMPCRIRMNKDGERVSGKESEFLEKARRAVREGRLASVGDIHDGWAVVMEPGGKYNYSDLDGKFMSKKWFDSASDFYQGKARVTRDGYDITIDSDGIVRECHDMGLRELPDEKCRGLHR